MPCLKSITLLLFLATPMNRQGAFASPSRIGRGVRESVDGVDPAQAETDRTLQIVSPGVLPRIWDRIRIEFDTTPLEAQRGFGVQRIQQIDRIVNDILPVAKERWEELLMVPRASSGILRRAAACGSTVGEALQEDTLFPDADLVIVVNGETCQGSTLAYATPCAYDRWDRPIVSLITFCYNAVQTADAEVASRYTGSDLRDQYSRWTNITFNPDHLAISLLYVTLHEVAHALGVTSTRFPYFRDEEGRPLTDRSATRDDCHDGTQDVSFFPSNNTVQLVPKENVGGFRQFVVTPRVQQIARNHFNCQTLVGARLEERDDRCRGTHWHEREYFSHMMSPTVATTSFESVSLLTLALLEDSGWYRVNYNLGSHPGFGLLAGCGFVDEDCIQNSTTAPWNAGEFCQDPVLRGASGTIEMSSLQQVVCDPSHESWAACDLFAHGADDPPDRSYFEDRNIAPLFEKADNCPIPRITLGLNCLLDEPYVGFYPGEEVGTSSRCINARHGTNVSGISYQPACMQVTCKADTRQVEIGQFDTPIICENTGDEIPIPGLEGGFFVCPRLAALCPELFTCRNGCHGRGKCIVENVTIPYCECDEAAGGDPDNDCAPPYAQDFEPPTLAPTSESTVFPQPSQTPVAASESPTIAPSESSAREIVVSWSLAFCLQILALLVARTS